MATNNYWMKLWFDILRDPKMGMLPDRLWRRVIELFLLAGQQGEEGLLPNPAEIAWQLNKSEKAIITDLEKIRKTGIVDINVDGVWYVTNFKKRNAPVSSSKRAKDYRMRNYGTEFTGKSNADDEKTERKENVNETLRSEEEQRNRRTEEQINNTTLPPLPPNENEIVQFGNVYNDITGNDPQFTPKEVDAIQEIIKAGGTTADYRKALEGMQAKHYTIATMASALKWTLGDIEKRKNPILPNNGYKPTKQLSAGLDEILDGAPIFAEDK